MRTNLFRAVRLALTAPRAARVGALAVAALLMCAATPALAQSVMRGKVVDTKGQPVVGATVLFEAQGMNRRTEVKTYVPPPAPEALPESSWGPPQY